MEKTAFDNQTLRHFKNLLVHKREEANRELEIIDDSISNMGTADDADYSSLTHHMGDVGSDTEELELNYKLRERTQLYLRQIDDALQRIENGTYGICLATGKPIEIKRLEAVPHTRYSMEAKQKGLVKE